MGVANSCFAHPDEPHKKLDRSCLTRARHEWENNVHVTRTFSKSSKVDFNSLEGASGGFFRYCTAFSYMSIDLHLETRREGLKMDSMKSI